MSYKIIVYEYQDSGKLKRISEFVRDPETKKFFTRARAQTFAKHLFAHKYDQEKYEIYVEPISAQTSSLDGATDLRSQCWGVSLAGNRSTWLKNPRGPSGGGVLIFPNKKSAEAAAVKQRQIWITRPSKTYWLAYPEMMGPYASEARILESVSAFAKGGREDYPDSAKQRPKKPVCVKRWRSKNPGMTKHEALRMCRMVGMPLKFSQKPPKTDSAVATKVGDIPITYTHRKYVDGEAGLADIFAAADCQQVLPPTPDGRMRIHCNVRPLINKPWSDVKKSGATWIQGTGTVEDPFISGGARDVALADSASSYMKSRKSKPGSSGSHKLRRVGTSKTHKTCQACGKTGLKKTYVFETRSGKKKYLGSECAKSSRVDHAEEKWYSYQDWIKDVEDRVVNSLDMPLAKSHKLFTKHKRKTSEALLERWKAHEPPFSVALDISETLIPIAESSYKHALKEFKSPKPIPTWEGKCLEEMISSGIAKNQREAFYLCIQAQQAGIDPRELVKRVKSKRGRWLVPVGLGVGLVAGYGISKAAGVI